MATPLASAQSPVAEPVTIVGLIESLRRGGSEIAYSSDLVPPSLRLPASDERDELTRLRAALAAQGLDLEAVGPRSFIITKSKPPLADQSVATGVRSDERVEPVQEVSVFASRYSLQGRPLVETRSMAASDIQQVPGSHDDAIRALRALPGIATNASGRPYVRGSLSSDVLFQFDGIPVLDPFHLKNFQSLISAVDPATIERIDVYSGGFPVRYGTRSGGVVDIVAPNTVEGVKHALSASLFAAGAATSGRAERWPVEWLVSARRSTLDLLEPVEEGFGKPEFQDSLARWRWHSQTLGTWTLGWLVLNDRVRLGSADDEEIADARYRDGYLWFAWDRSLGESWTFRSALVRTDARRSREGLLNRPGIASAQLREAQQFDSTELISDWNYQISSRDRLNLGFSLASARANYDYSRQASFSTALASAFSRAASDDLALAIAPRSRTAALYAAQRWQRRRWETELGMRWDYQHFEPGASHHQLSPRVNIRFDVNERWRLHASAGRFTQAQRVEEWRVEAAQTQPDATINSWHAVLGADFQPDPANKWSLEVYSKQWSSIAPYYDNRLDPLSLLPDLAVDRILLRPGSSEALGLELIWRSKLTDRLTAQASLTFSRVADDFGGRDVRRSWDQPLALTAGLNWSRSRGEISALATWHRGWPRTQLQLQATGANAAVPIVLGARNLERWRDYLTLDVRATRRWRLGDGDLTAHLEVTNASNRENPCCITLESGPTGIVSADIDHWLPLVANIGLTYHWGSGR
jgi:hypothetical protein